MDSIEMMEKALENALKRLDQLTVGSVEYERAANAVSAMQRSLSEAKAQQAKSDLEKERLEIDDRSHGDDLVKWQEEKTAKDQMDKVEKRCRIVQTIASVFGVVAPTVLYGLCFGAGLDFEQSGTFTSVVSKKNLDNIFRIRK